MQLFGSGGTGSLIIVLFGVLVVLVVYRVLRRGWRFGPAGTESAHPGKVPGAAAEDPAALVAVIAAAVAAASGAEPGSFRVTGIEASSRATPSRTTGSGFTTPVWGHVDRLARRLGSA
ncbi:MAG TPA: hypothetical protein VMC79_14260 [Rectinemataceae bacterium]|nr:hypothetical protein [Rectinemataceae bacterium]